MPVGRRYDLSVPQSSGNTMRGQHEQYCTVHKNALVRNNTEKIAFFVIHLTTPAIPSLLPTSFETFLLCSPTGGYIVYRYFVGNQTRKREEDCTSNSEADR